MFFTREDIDKIYQGLLARGIKDSEFPETNGVKVDDTLAIIQDGENKQINVREFLDQISLWKKESFINNIKGLEKRVEELEKKVQQLINQLTAE